MSNMRNKRNFIKDARLARGWKTKQLADEMTKAGCYIHHDTVRRHERGVRAVSPVQQVAYALVLGGNLSQLFEGYDGVLTVGSCVCDVDETHPSVSCETLLKLQEHGGGLRAYGSRRKKEESTGHQTFPMDSAGELNDWQDVSEEARSSKLPVVP